MTACTTSIPASQGQGQVDLNRLHCANCGRSLLHPVFVDGVAYGSSCAASLYGAKPSAVHIAKATHPDERQAELWPGLWATLKTEVRSWLKQANVWLGGGK